MGKSLLKTIAPIALGATGLGMAGMLPSLGALGSAGAAGTASGALGAQGAAGLLGSAGATAAGYGAPAMASGLASAGTAAFGANGEFMGKTIESELSKNMFTGGYDNLNPLQRIGQSVEGFMSGDNGSKLAKLGVHMMSQGGGTQGAASHTNIKQAMHPTTSSPTSPASFEASSNIDELRKQYYRNLGRV